MVEDLLTFRRPRVKYMSFQRTTGCLIVESDFNIDCIVQPFGLDVLLQGQSNTKSNIKDQ